MIRLAARLAMVGSTVVGIVASQLAAQVPQDQPFSMRGVRLGITLDEFRQVPIPQDHASYDRYRAYCSNEVLPWYVLIPILSEETAAGVVQCDWRASMKTSRIEAPTTQWVKIGTGGGEPTFQFIDSGGELRLFRISFYSHEDFYEGTLDALTRGYGSPKVGVVPFNTKAGGKFTSVNSVWHNPLSTITLIQRCGRLDRFCLTYEHTALAKIYEQNKEQQAAAAATKI